MVNSTAVCLPQSSNNVLKLASNLMSGVLMARWRTRENHATTNAGTHMKIVRNFTRLPHWIVLKKTSAYHWTRCAQEFARQRRSFAQRDLRCLGDGLLGSISYRPGNYTITSLNTKLAENHNYCLRVNNDVGYDTISRKDEVKILGDNERSVDYGGLVKCLDTSFAGDGIQCPGDKIKCLSQDYWCSGYGNVCGLAVK